MTLSRLGCVLGIYALTRIAFAEKRFVFDLP